MQITEIITDETLREIREHGTPEFPFEYYLDDIDEIGQGYVEWHWHNEIEWAWVEIQIRFEKRVVWNVKIGKDYP